MTTPAKSSAPKPAKAWAIVDTERNHICLIGMRKDETIMRAYTFPKVRAQPGNHTFEYDLNRSGYRCIRVLITPSK